MNQVFLSPFTPEQCAARLQPLVTEESVSPLWSDWMGASLIGYVDLWCFNLRRAAPLARNRHLIPSCAGTFTANESGTVISASVDTPRHAYWSFALMLLILVFLMPVFFLQAETIVAAACAAIWLFVPMLMFVVGAPLYRKWNKYATEQYFCQLFVNVLHAEPVLLARLAKPTSKNRQNRRKIAGCSSEF